MHIECIKTSSCAAVMHNKCMYCIAVNVRDNCAECRWCYEAQNASCRASLQPSWPRRTNVRWTPAATLWSKELRRSYLYKNNCRRTAWLSTATRRDTPCVLSPGRLHRTYTVYQKEACYFKIGCNFVMNLNQFSKTFPSTVPYKCCW